MLYEVAGVPLWPSSAGAFQVNLMDVVVAFEAAKLEICPGAMVSPVAATTMVPPCEGNR